MKQSQRIPTLFLFFLLCTSSLCQGQNDSLHSNIDSLVEIAGWEPKADSMIYNMRNAQLSVTDSAYHKIFDTTQADRLLDSIKYFYSRHYTQKEISKLIEFYQTEVGKKMLDVSEKIFTNLFNASSSIVDETIGEYLTYAGKQNDTLNENQACESLKNGKYFYLGANPDGEKDTIFVERRGNRQTEYTKNGSTTYKIEWVENCTYHMESLSSTGPFDDESIGQTFTTVIFDVREDAYHYLVLDGNLTFLDVRWMYRTDKTIASFDSLMILARAEFSKGENNDYSYAKNLLERAIALRPNSQEAHFYLGLAYDQINFYDYTMIPEIRLGLTKKASQQMEKVIAIDSTFDTDISTFDPYAALTGIWAAQAMKYLYFGKYDSARWALQEGRKRGGFNDAQLQVARYSLDACDNNALLLLDNEYTFSPVLYLQLLEEYRTDVQTMMLSLLTSDWYPFYLEKETALQFSLTKHDLIESDYVTWADSSMDIPVKNDAYVDDDFEWTVKPTIEGGYLTQADFLTYLIIHQNAFKRKVYFNFGSQYAEDLNLRDDLKNLMWVEELSPDHFKMLNEASQSSMYAYSSFDKQEITLATHSKIIAYHLNSARWLVLNYIEKLVDEDEMSEARKMYETYSTRFPDQYFEEDPDYIKELKAKLPFD